MSEMGEYAIVLTDETPASDGEKKRGKKEEKRKHLRKHNLSRMSCLLTSSLSLGVSSLFCRAPQCMRADSSASCFGLSSY